MSDTKSVCVLGAFVIAMLCLLGWAFVSRIETLELKYAERQKKVQQDGSEAARNNVPATANPYIRDPSSAALWLDSWMQEQNRFQMHGVKR